MSFSYDSIAENYARSVDSAPYNAYYERPGMLALLPQLEGLRILDAGCGSGWYSEQLVARGATVDAVDASASMVDYARERLKSAPATQRAHFQVADLAASLPFETSTFDGILSALVLHYMKDWRPALAEMRRVLKPGGWLQFSTHHPAADAALFQTKNYFATEHVVDHWDWVGEVQFYRRSLSEIVSSLTDEGFVTEKLVEPAPTDEMRAAKPEAYAQLMNQPQFLIIVAKPSTTFSLPAGR